MTEPIHLLSKDKMAIVKRIEFCNAAKNSGVVLYARKWDISRGECPYDSLDRVIIELIQKEYPDAQCNVHSSVFDKDIEDVIRLKEGLELETLPIYMVNIPEDGEMGERSISELQIYLFENKLKYPRKTYILVSTSNKEEYEKIRDTYLKFSEYEESLLK